MIINPAKMGLSCLLALVLLGVGAYAITIDKPEIILKTTASEGLASDSSEQQVPIKTEVNQISSVQTDRIEQVEQNDSINDTMDMSEMQKILEEFDPITSGDWSLDKLSNYALEL